MKKTPTLQEMLLPPEYPKRWWTIAETSYFLGVSQWKLRYWRLHRKGPPWKILYCAEDVVYWQKKKKVEPE